MSVTLGIVIIHYNTPDDLERCLASLHEQAPACAHEIVVVDNASTAPDLDRVRDRFPACHWLMNTENRGYARGCNQGLAQVAADYYLILNPDIVVLPGSLDALVAFAAARPRAGIIGPQLLNDDGSVQESCRRFYTLRTLLLRRTPLGRVVPRSRTVSRHLMRDFDHLSERPVDWVLGGCLLVRRDALARCGPMDERFFLYFEDVDWCYRMWRCGYEVVYTPAARFVHRHRRASARGPLTRSYWLHLTSLMSFYEKWGVLVYLLKKWRQPLDQIGLWLLDMVLLLVAFLTAYGVRRAFQPLFPETLFPLSWYRGFLAYAALLVTVTFLLLGRYRGERLRRLTRLGEYVRQQGLVGLLLLATPYLGRQDVVSRAVLVLFLALFTGLTILGEQIFTRLRRRMERGYFSLERTLLVATPAQLQQWLGGCPDPRREGIDPVGYVTDAPVTDQELEIPWLGPVQELPALVERLRVSQVVFWQAPRGDAAELAQLRRARIRLRWRIDEAWMLEAGARAETFGADVSGVLDPDDGQTLRRAGLRVLGLVVGAALAVVAVWSRGHSGREIIDWRGAGGHNLRVTIATGRDGRILPLWRQWPLVVALLRGHVSLVGPRPNAWDADPFWNAISAPPGLTGAWAGGRGSTWRTLWFQPGGSRESGKDAR